MTSLMTRSARKFMLIKAARQIKEEIEKAGLDTLKTLAEKDISIVSTYLNNCSSEEKATHRQDLNLLLRMGVTVDALLDEVARQMPGIAPTIKNKPAYKRTEIVEIERFLKGG